jgi:MFS family permease
METKFTEQESLAVINEMINRVRHNVQKGSGMFMIYWGIMVAVAALLNIVLVFILTSLSIPANYSFHIWWIMLPAWIVSFILERKVNRKAIVKTHIDNIISSVWQAFGISILIFLAFIFWLGFSSKAYGYFLLINPVIMLITAIGEYITAKACRFRPFMYGAIATWIGSLICAMAIVCASKPVIVQLAVLAITMIAGFVIPGYQINKIAQKDV